MHGRLVGLSISLRKDFEVGQDRNTKVTPFKSFEAVIELEDKLLPHPDWQRTEVFGVHSLIFRSPNRLRTVAIHFDDVEKELMEALDGQDNWHDKDVIMSDNDNFSFVLVNRDTRSEIEFVYLQNKGE